MKQLLRSVIILILVAIAAAAQAQNYPVRPVRLVLGPSPDLLSRMVGQKPVSYTHLTLPTSP
jgi:hypothetical protein